MTRVLIATDSEGVLDQVAGALADSTTSVERVARGAEVRTSLEETPADLVILDMQIGNMGGFAVSLDLRNEESADRLGPQRILLLLDREADSFLAERSGADAWITKPFDALEVRRAAAELLSQEALEPG